MEPLCGRGHRLEFTLAGGDGPDYPGEFVGDSNRGFVVSPRAVDLPRPGAELVGRALADVGRSEHGASAPREERTEVGVATLGDAPEAANVTTGVLFGNEAEVTREAASRWEAAQIPNEADDGGRGQKSDAGNGEKSLHLRKLLGERLELVLDASALVLELSNLGARITQVRTEHVGQIRISVFDELGDGGHDEVSAVLRNKEDRPEAAEHSRSRTRNQRWIDFLRSTPVANTETMLLVYGLFQKGRVLAQDALLCRDDERIVRSARHLPKIARRTTAHTLNSLGDATLVNAKPTIDPVDLATVFLRL